MADWKRHPLSAVWGDLPEADMEGLQSDIEKNGLANPIVWLHQGEVLDGWHRYLACRALEREHELEPVVYEGDDAAAFTVSQNRHRRHLTVGQRSMIAHELSEYSAQGRPAGKPENFPVLSQSKAAEQMQVSDRSVRTAKTIKEQAPEKAKAVSEGRMSLNAAAKAIKEPAPEKADAVKKDALVVDGAAADEKASGGPMREEAKGAKDGEAAPEKADAETDAAGIPAYRKMKARIKKLKKRLKSQKKTIEGLNRALDGVEDVGKHGVGIYNMLGSRMVSLNRSFVVIEGLKRMLFDMGQDREKVLNFIRSVDNLSDDEVKNRADGMKS